MPLREKSVMEQRQEFVRLAEQDGANRRELCRRFGISADTAYRWLGRWERGDAALADRSRRPHHSPRRTEASVEARILAMRDAHPAWGARKIAHCLARDGLRCPTISTVHEVLRRSGRVVTAAGAGVALQRFEKPAANLLWQMDFKGWFGLSNERHALPSADHAGRSFAVSAVSGSLCR